MTGTMQIKKALNAASVTVKFDDGGKTQVVTVDGQEYRLPANLHCPQIIAAIKSEREQ